MTGRKESPADGVSGTARYWVVEADLHPRDEEVWSLFCHEQGAIGSQTAAERPDRVTLRHFFSVAPFPSPPEILKAFAARFPAASPPQRVTLTSHPVEAWDKAWRSHFQPLEVGRRLLVCPPWEAGQGGAGERLRVVIDPGRGFGTGWHPSTHLALELIEDLLLEHSAPRGMADVGTGSGILAIAAALLGARPRAAVDLDGDVFAEVRRNFALSGHSPPHLLARGGPDCLKGPFSLVTANITAPVLLAHRAALADLTGPGGWLIVSGVLRSEREALLEGFGETALIQRREMHRQEWWACRFQRPPGPA